MKGPCGASPLVMEKGVTRTDKGLKIRKGKLKSRRGEIRDDERTVWCLTASYGKGKTRIELVGKPYREVCLCSELWPWMAHQPNSWSKHPGTRIEQVLTYCRDEQKYVGCIELLFCLTVTKTFGVRTWKFIGLLDEILPIYQPGFTEIRSKISVQHIFQGCLLVTSTFNPRPWNWHQVVSLSRTINQLNLKMMGW